MAAPLPPDLAIRVLAAVQRLRQGSVTSPEASEVAHLVSDLSEAMMKHYFLEPTRAFGLGVASRSVVELSVASANKTVRFGLGRVLPKLNDAQWQQLADFLDRSLIASPSHQGLA